MQQIDQIFLGLTTGDAGLSPIIVCFFTSTGAVAFCESMARAPAPEVGMLFDGDFQNQRLAALTRNPAVHDGAILVGRASDTEPYRIVGWSQRLFPPHGTGDAPPNRGSAFNSCLAMSEVLSVDCVYMVSKGEAFRFVNGIVCRINS